MKPVLSLALVVGLASPVWAETTVDIDATRACIQKQIDTNAPVAACVNQAHEPCLTFGMEVPAATVLCFSKAQSTWIKAMQAIMDDIKTKTPERSYQFTEINTRFDIMQNLLQCDRMNELSLLSESNADSINIQNARCRATATGLAFVKLTLQTRGQ